ncbi:MULTISPECIES: ferrous iron transport protein B [Fusobacterium]|uniref:ferrous iron transport protein B n=1 Tax=Fusobacterium TaxID=848 RepID=UPI001F34632C|nr:MULTISPECIES: ferrous iron transport protein B [Fusobacterium]MCF2612658.1 ferrous iron transport protein B [Fusobacterium perfoetens]MDY2980422.1 ferrous iron transport protein B [Fusobacterium sp.]
MIKIAFAGNPNVGKSALINAIAGSNLKVGNWAGVTVEKKEASFVHNGEEITMIDLPGVYSLSPRSLEENITRDFITDENPDVIINVIEAPNIERNLYLTLLLKELGKPMVMALNFYDEFENLNHSLDIPLLSEKLEMPVVKTSAIKGTGLSELLNKAIEVAKAKKIPSFKITFDSYIDEQYNLIKKKITADKKLDKIVEKYGINFVIIKLLEKDVNFLKKSKDIFGLDIENYLDENIKVIEDKYDDDIDTILAERRYGEIKGILADTLKTSLKSRLDFSEKIDKVLLNRAFGLPIFFLIIGLLMTVVFNGSAPFIDWIDGFIGGFIGKYVGLLVEGTPDWLQSLVVDGIIGGVGGVLTFIPLMFLLYFFLSILEESGYMSRVAFLMDKIMRTLGLNGKAFVPMVVGFGCTVPAIYSTRTLEDQNSRKLTAALVPFMSCGARLPVYGLFTAAFFGQKAGLVVMSLYMFGIVIAILLGTFLKRFDEFKGENKALLIELAPYRIPGLKVILKSACRRTGGYLKKATSIILGILMLLWALTYFPNQGDAEHSYMATIGKTIAPVLKPTGFADRWEPVAAVVPSIAAKEIVVGFMAQVLELPEEETEEVVEEPTTFSEDLKEQVVGLGQAFVDSAKGILSFDIAGLFSAPSAEEVEEEGMGVVKATSNLWTDDLAPLRAYSFMVFILTVVPCAVTLGAIKQEFGTKYLLKLSGIMLIIPYICSTLIFQIGRLFM